MTTIKHAKQVLSLFLAFLLICQSAVAAGQKSKFELGLEAIDSAKWDIAIRYFKSVGEDDPNYKEARKRIGLAQEEQEKALAKSKFQNKFKQETDKCRDLFHIDRSPETQRCIERVNELNKEGLEKFGGIALASYEALTVDYSPYSTINEVTERVRGVALDVNGIASAASDLLFIETFMADPKMPMDAKLIGAIVGTQIYKGASLAFQSSCQTARAGTDQNAADEICGNLERALGKYAGFRNFVVDNSPALTGKSVPLMIWHDYNPLSQTVSALPHPDAMVVAGAQKTNTVNTIRTQQIAAASSSSEQKIPVIPVPEEKSSSWLPMAAAGAVTLAAIVGTIIWKTSTKEKPTPHVGAPVMTAAAPPPAARPPSPNARSLVQSVAQETTRAASASVPSVITSVASSASSIASSAEVLEVKKLLAAWVNGEAVPKAKDKTLSALIDYCAKVGVEVVQNGQPRSATLVATVSKPDSVSELAKMIMELVLQARR